MDKINNTFRPSNNALISCLLIGAVAPVTSYANNIDDIISDFSAGASVYSDKNGISIKDWQLGYENGRKSGTKWKIESHYHDVENEGDKDTYHGEQILGTITQEFNEYIQAELSVGAVYMENQRTHNDKNFTKYKAKVTTKPTKNLTISAEHGEDLLFSEALIEDDNNQLLSGKTSRVSGNWRAAKRIIVEGSSQYRELSDGNRAKQHRGAVLYGISPDTPWVWAGVEAQSLSYDEKKSNYWSPEEYEAYAVVVTSNVKVNDKLSVDVSGNLNRTKEDNFDWSSGNAVSVGATYKVSENTKVKAHATHLESSREKESWNGNSVGASFVVSHF